MGMTLRENQRDYYFDRLEEHFKGLKDKYIKTYGEKYNCIVPNYKYLFKVFSDFSQIAHDKPEIEKHSIKFIFRFILRGVL